ncbi:MAG: exopolyphosphatase [Acidobacteria bacterium]|nr:exopolyphosphatase [Acidobacteriota bacterium]
MRLITRGDLDGLTCAVFITSVERVSSIELTHPQELTDRKFPVEPGDIIANLPYHPNAGLWFDHHELTDSNPQPPPEGFKGSYGRARSAARLVHDYYEEIKGKGFFAKHAELLDGTDRLDSALLTERDVLNPERVILLGFTLDSRSGLGGFRDYFLFLGMALRSMTLDEVLESDPVKERVAKMRADDAAFRDALLANSKALGNVVVTDFRHVDVIPTGNRFLIHTLFPECTISVRLQWGPQRKVVMATAGHNIFDRSSWSNIGHTMSLFGGGGHRGAGSAPLPADDGDAKLRELIKELQAQG